MVNTVSIKVYNKENKLKLLVQETKSLKIVDIYKYDGENMDKHSFTSVLNMHKFNTDRITYYDFMREESGIMVERLYYTNLQKEHWELVGDNEEITISTIFKSGNKYEKRVKYLDGEKYIAEFKNGEFFDFQFSIQENKIKEYLETLSYGK